MTPSQLSKLLEALIRGSRALRERHDVATERRQTTTGSAQLHVTIDGQAFNITVTKARS